MSSLQVGIGSHPRSRPRLRPGRHAPASAAASRCPPPTWADAVCPQCLLLQVRIRLSSLFQAAPLTGASWASVCSGVSPPAAHTLAVPSSLQVRIRLSSPFQAAPKTLSSWASVRLGTGQNREQSAARQHKPGRSQRFAGRQPPAAPPGLDPLDFRRQRPRPGPATPSGAPAAARFLAQPRPSPNCAWQWLR